MYKIELNESEQRWLTEALAERVSLQDDAVGRAWSNTKEVSNDEYVEAKSVVLKMRDLLRRLRCTPWSDKREISFAEKFWRKRADNLKVWFDEAKDEIARLKEDDKPRDMFGQTVASTELFHAWHVSPKAHTFGGGMLNVAAWEETEQHKADTEKEDAPIEYKQYVWEDCHIEATPDVRALSDYTWVRHGALPLRKGDMIARNPFLPQDTWIISKDGFASAVEFGSVPTKEQDEAYKSKVVEELCEAVENRKVETACFDSYIYYGKVVYATKHKIGDPLPKGFGHFILSAKQGNVFGNVMLVKGYGTANPKMPYVWYVSTKDFKKDFVKLRG